MAQLLDGMRTSEIRWLHAQPGQQQAGRGAARGGPRALHEARRRWLARWLWWLLADLALPLLRACFYCTESEPYRQQVFYYRCNCAAYTRAGAAAVGCKCKACTEVAACLH